MSCCNNTVTLTNIHFTTVMLHQQSTKHITDELYFLPHSCVYILVVYTYVCVYVVYCVHFIMYSVLAALLCCWRLVISCKVVTSFISMSKEKVVASVVQNLQHY